MVKEKHLGLESRAPVRHPCVSVCDSRSRSRSTCNLIISNHQLSRSRKKEIKKVPQMVVRLTGVEVHQFCLLCFPLLSSVKNSLLILSSDKCRIKTVNKKSTHRTLSGATMPTTDATAGFETCSILVLRPTSRLGSRSTATFSWSQRWAFVS